MHNIIIQNSYEHILGRRIIQFISKHGDKITKLYYFAIYTYYIISFYKHIYLNKELNNNIIILMSSSLPSLV